MEWAEYSRFILALVFVLGLIAVAAWIARKFGLMPNLSAKIRPGQRLQIVEMINIDAKRRLLLVRHDRDEHLILLGGDGDLLIESKSKNAINRIDEKTGIRLKESIDPK